jgi:hypothetical protein
MLGMSSTEMGFPLTKSRRFSRTLAGMPSASSCFIWGGRTLFETLYPLRKSRRMYRLTVTVVYCSCVLVVLLIETHRRHRGHELLFSSHFWRHVVQNSCVQDNVLLELIILSKQMGHSLSVLTLVSMGYILSDFFIVVIVIPIQKNSEENTQMNHFACF